MTRHPYAISEGERGKADALALLEARRETIVNRGRRILLEECLLAMNGQATIDDVRDGVELPPSMGPKCFGSVPGPLVRSGIIRAAGFAKTLRAIGHARPVTVWELADRGKAERWLRDYPDLPDPADDDAGACSQRVLFPLEPTNEPGAAVTAATPGME